MPGTRPGMTAFWGPTACPRLSGRRAREHRLGSVDMFVPLALGGVVIAAGVIGYGAVVVAVRSAVGAGEIFDGVGEIGVGIAQAFGRAGVTKVARGRELDLHEADGAASSDQARLIAAFT